MYPISFKLFKNLTSEGWKTDIFPIPWLPFLQQNWNSLLYAGSPWFVVLPRHFSCTVVDEDFPGPSPLYKLWSKPCIHQISVAPCWFKLRVVPFNTSRVVEMASCDLWQMGSNLPLKLCPLPEFNCMITSAIPKVCYWSHTRNIFGPFVKSRVRMHIIANVYITVSRKRFSLARRPFHRQASNAEHIIGSLCLAFRYFTLRLLKSRIALNLDIVCVGSLLELDPLLPIFAATKIGWKKLNRARWVE